MTPKARLTARQQEIFDLIKQRILETGLPPSRAEIASSLGFASANAAQEHLQALVRKGVIELMPGTSRGIRIHHGHVGKQSKELDSAAPLGSDSFRIPLVGRVSAGAPILAQEHIEQHYLVESALFSHKPDYLLQVRGMSMRDVGIMDGDLLAVRASKEARDGQIVVARLGDEVTVKRLKRQSNCIELHPENPDYSIIVVAPQDTFSIEGIAVGLIRKQLF